MEKKYLKKITKKITPLKKLETKNIKGGSIITEEIIIGIGTDDIVVF